jgi:FkbM family methyltransferase
MDILNNIKKPNVFIQIGTNDGDDNFRKLIIKHKPKKVILVEPNKDLITKIEKNYNCVKNICDVQIVNKAVYINDNKEVSLFIPAKNGVYGKKGVQPERKQGNHKYTHHHFSLLPMNDWGEKKHMIEIKSNSVTFDSLCQKYNIKDIDYLQIDTEGFDSEIIKSIDFNKFNIKTLRYEKWDFDTECFSKYHNENKEKYGINGMRKIKEKLTNYNLSDIKDKDGRDILAVKKNLF